MSIYGELCTVAGKGHDIFFSFAKLSRDKMNSYRAINEKISIGNHMISSAIWNK